MNPKIVFACLAFLPSLAVAQSDFSLASTTPIPQVKEPEIPLPPPLADVAVRSRIDLARPKSPSMEVLLKDVVNDLKLHNYDSALPKLEFLQSVRPAEPDILILRGCIYAESGHPDVAEGLFLKAIQISPTHPWARLNLAEAQVNQKKYFEAEKTLSLLSVTRPESEVVRFKLITVMAMLNKFGPAEQELQLLRENASTPAFYYASAAVAFAQNNSGKAREFLEQAHKLYTDAQTSYFSNVLVSMGWMPKSP